MTTPTPTIRTGPNAILLTLLFLLGFSLKTFAAFVHPGGLHTQADYTRMAAKVAAGSTGQLPVRSAHARLG